MAARDLPSGDASATPGAGVATGVVLRLPPKVLVVTGATATGKSELAVTLAEALGGEVVGADSRQVYRRLDAGTAKPGPELRRRAHHHLIDVVEPDEDFDVAAWRDAAMTALADIHARGRIPIVCGGTGLYLRSLERGLFRGPAADHALRARLESEEAASPGTLHARLLEADPASGRRIHAHDLVRVVRALEVLEATGRPLSAWLAEHALGERPFETLSLEVELAKEELVRRIAARAVAMVECGIVEEMRGLMERGLDPSARAFDAIGYREAFACLHGLLAREDLAGEITRSTVRYAKRQRTWLRGQAETVKVASGDAAAALALARAFFS